MLDPSLKKGQVILMTTMTNAPFLSNTAALRVRVSDADVKLNSDYMGEVL